MMFKRDKSRVVNLGCRLNFFESDIISSILSKNKINNKVVINTCAVTNNAVQKSILAVKKAVAKYPDKEIFITGCASQIEPEHFKKLKNVTKIIDNMHKTNSNVYTQKVIKDQYYKFPDIPIDSLSRTRATIQIQQGCDHRCTFCIIPFGRGDSVSLPVGEVSRRVQLLIEKGFKEIVLTGVDLTSYGHDLPGKPKLGNMLKRIFKLHPNLKRLRLSSIDPAEVDEDLIELFKFEKRIMPHIHFSIQSGDNLILKRMKRRHNREDVIDICNDLKRSRKDLTFGADMIIGFPTEDEKKFENSLNLISKCNFSNVHFFPFSPKKGTPAFKMPQVNSNDIKNRIKYARRFASNILSKIMNDQIGKNVNVLYESNKRSYTDNFFKVNLNFKNSSSKKMVGSIIKVKLKSIKDGAFLAS